MPNTSPPSSPSPHPSRTTTSCRRILIGIPAFAVIILAIIFSPVVIRSFSPNLLRSFSPGLLRSPGQIHQNIPVVTRFMSTPASPPSSSSPSSASSPSLSNPVTMPKKLSAEDKEWNHLAEHMDRFHAHFRYEFNRVYTLADGGFHTEGMTLPRFIREAQQLHHHLDMHHRIEEAYIFPILAKKMPQFQAGAREGGEHLESHRQIHEGLERYEKYLEDSLANSSKYNAGALRAIMDGFREVLFRHLDEEVHDLGAESMKAAGWTLKEIRAIPM
ncbi:hypothetical protein BCR39DRAFT_509569 [Naematelia encephala]|uniref:Hemerythrin-like domain-containing protein n=1 Tax=Naematelia encephala TaxID=71784 RepID=A0A1Y2BKX9_9TREE|nr:hypothetical protein BCR39DRAFT_509569 [Naematelia encephala]